MSSSPPARASVKNRDAMLRQMVSQSVRHDPSVARARQRLRVLRVREKVGLWVIAALAAVAVGAIFALDHLQKERVLDAARSLSTQVFARRPDLAAEVAPLVACAADREIEKAGALQYFRTRGGAISEALSVSALDCASSAGEEPLAKMRAALFDERPA